MGVVSGQLTFTATGSASYNIGLAANGVEFYCGPRDGVTETVGYLNIGHADGDNQFAIAHKDGKTVCKLDRCVVAYNSSGTEVLNVEFTGFSGTSLTFNVHTYNVDYPVQIVARS